MRTYSRMTEEELTPMPDNYSDVKKAYWTIDEVSKRFDLSHGTLRNWEKEFGIPVKRKELGKAGLRGTRWYNVTNIESIAILVELIYIGEFSHKKVKQKLQERGLMDGKHFNKQ